MLNFQFKDLQPIITNNIDSNIEELNNYYEETDLNISNSFKKEIQKNKEDLKIFISFLNQFIAIQAFSFNEDTTYMEKFIKSKLKNKLYLQIFNSLIENVSLQDLNENIENSKLEKGNFAILDLLKIN